MLLKKKTFFNIQVIRLIMVLKTFESIFTHEINKISYFFQFLIPKFYTIECRIT